MQYEGMTKKKLLDELKSMRQRVEELEGIDSEQKRVKEERDTIYEISQLFLKEESSGVIYKKLPELLSERLRYPMVAIELYDRETQEMVFVSTTGIPMRKSGPLRVPVGETISGKVVKTKNAIVETNAGRRPEYRFRELSKLGVTTFICVPMKVQENVLGAFSLADTERRDIDDELVKTVQIISDEISLYLERKKAEEDLNIVSEEKEDLSRSLFSLMNNVPGIVYRGLPDWSITIIGADLERITGYKPEEVTKGELNWSNAIHPDDIVTLKSKFREAVRQKKGVLSTEYRFIKKDGTYCWLEDRRQLIYDDEGTFIYVDGLLLDITEKKMADAVILESEEKFRSVMETATDAIISVNSLGNVVFWNPTAEDIFGYSAEEVMGRSVSQVMPERYKKSHYNGIKRLVDGGEPKLLGNTVEIEGIRKDGSEFPIGLSLSKWKTEKGVFFTAIIRDITEQKLAEKKIEEMATTDELTGLRNRRFFTERIGEECKRARRYDCSLGCMMIDIDFFKQVNDKYGHDAGDKVLQVISEIIRGNCRDSDMFARFGGEEFIGILPETNLDGTLVVAERLRSVIESSMISISGEIEIYVTASFGITSISPDKWPDIKDYKDVIKVADEALYRAKEKGRNRVETG